MSAFQAEYSGLDRMLHRFAFNGIGLQKIIAELEDDLYARDLREIEIVRPVFITSLPRAGTTLLLNLLTDLPDNATHCYRNMPFLLCPLLWDKVSRPFRKQATMRERAHGDGVDVGFDSPEAFEEIVWKSFWPEKYRDGSIDTWTPDDRSDEFETFLRSHMRKILFLGGSGAEGRYISKNNANIARLEILPRLFPDCRIVVPFRNPLDHVGSLLRQHRSFLEMHAADPFAADYMASIGHHDFGVGLKPLDFDGWFTSGPGIETADDPLRRAFWLRYWLAGFDYLLAHANDNVVLIDYDRLCQAPERGLRVLFDAIGYQDASVSALAKKLHVSTRYDPKDFDVSPELKEQALAMHTRLAGLALNAEDAESAAKLRAAGG